jgi:hypothetical protein
MWKTKFASLKKENKDLAFLHTIDFFDDLLERNHLRMVRSGNFDSPPLCPDESWPLEALKENNENQENKIDVDQECTTGFYRPQATPLYNLMVTGVNAKKQPEYSRVQEGSKHTMETSKVIQCSCIQEV